MGDVYVEYSTEMLPVPVIRRIITNLFIALGVLLIIYSVLFMPILWTIGIVFFALAYFYRRGNHFQYEYLLLNDTFHVDKIINNLKRRKAYRGSLEYMDLFTDDPDLVDQYTKNGKKLKRKYYTYPGEKVYCLVLRTDHGTDCLYLNADDEFVQAVRRLHPMQTKLTGKR